MANILVTGGTGVVGSAVARNLVERGDKTILYDVRKDFSLIKDIAEEVVFEQGDVTNLPQLLSSISTHEVEYIIHTAVLLDLGLWDTLQVNVVGTANVLEAGRALNSKRVVFCSTRGVYGDFTGDYGHPSYKLVTEDYPKISSPTDRRLYNPTKQFCEHLGLAYHKQYGVDFVALRFGQIYGLGGLARHGPFAWVSLIIENAMAGKPTKIPQGAEQKQDFVYVKDVAQGLVKACFVQGLEHRLFNVASGEGQTLMDLAYVVKRLIPEAVVDIGPGLDFMGHGLPWYAVFDISRARRELGYEPRYHPLEKGVQDYMEMVRRLDLLP